MGELAATGLELRERRWRQGLLGSLGGLLLLGLGVLVYQPQGEPCQGIWIPWLAPPAERLYCAGLKAQSGRAEDLQAAIALANQIPEGDPLRTLARRYRHQWLWQVLDLAQLDLDRGQLQPALRLLESLPVEACRESNCPDDEVRQRLQHWPARWQADQTAWSEARTALNDQRWEAAAGIAARLLASESQFWRVKRYGELQLLITRMGAKGSPFVEARQKAATRQPEDLLGAMQLMQAQLGDAQLGPFAKSALNRYSRILLDRAWELAEQGQDTEALALVARIPAAAGLNEHVSDFRRLSQWRTEARRGDAAALTLAISRAQEFGSDRPLAERAQALQDRWQSQLLDLERLELAKRQATSGRLLDLQAALGTILIIPTDHPRSAEIRQLQQQWQAQVETLEDQPLLAQAERYARQGDWISAIGAAEQIRPERRLYPQAQSRLRQWRARANLGNDQALLQSAEASAAQGYWEEAIAAARQISPESLVYARARSLIQQWQQQLTPAPVAPAPDPATP